MEEVKNFDLSIIILSYKSQLDLERLLPSVFASETKYSYEVIIVDNGSNDGTYEWIQEYSIEHTAYSIKAIKNQNTGFAAGNNLGIKQASGKYILLLNPDTKIEKDTLEVMLDFMDSRPEVGISGCKVIKPDGSLDLACRRKFPNPWNSFKRLFLLSNADYNLTAIDVNQEMEIDSVMGAFLLIRKPVVELIGLLDEDFFMYGEDMDWCWRCKEEGFKVWYYPKTFITHFKGSSSAKIALKALKWFHDAMWIFYKKHYKSKYPFYINWLVWLGVHLRLGILILINIFKDKPTVSK